MCHVYYVKEVLAYMLLKLISDINKARENECYFAALALALTLPDVCGKAEYPTLKNGDRYKRWYDEHVGTYEKCSCEWCQKHPMPYLSGEIIYSLRNALLHQGTPGIDGRKIKDPVNQVDEFILVLEKKNEFDIYSDASSVTSVWDGNEKQELTRTYRVNVQRLCFILTRVAQEYYEAHQDKFSFLQFSIVDNTKIKAD